MGIFTCDSVPNRLTTTSVTSVTPTRYQTRLLPPGGDLRSGVGSIERGLASFSFHAAFLSATCPIPVSYSPILSS